MNNLQANFCLLAVTFCWSCEVIIFSVIPEGVNPFATTCVTSAIGALLLGVCFARRIAQALSHGGLYLVRRIAALSIMNTAYNVLFLVGLNRFDLSTGAFTISITVVVLPVMLMVMRRGVALRTWISAACVLLGIVVSMAASFELAQVEGLLIMGIGCLIRALFIVKLNDYAREHDPLTLASVMSAMNAIIAFFPWLIMQPATFAALPWSKELIATYFIYGYFVTALTTALNILAQRRATPEQATIIYSTEIVFSTIWATCLPATIVDPVVLTPPIVIGCVLIVVGNLVEIMPIGSLKEDEEDPVEAAAPPTATDDVVLPAVPEAAGLQTLDTPEAANMPFARIKRPRVRAAALFATLIFVYLVVAMPFKVLEIIPGFTDIRPVMTLQPVYGIFFGVIGCLANAVGNLIVDIMSGGLRLSSLAAFVANFLYPYLMWLFWTRLRKEAFALRSERALALFALTVLACACLQSLIISPVVAGFYPDVDVVLFAMTVIGNGTLFPIVFGIPIIILLQEEFGFCPFTGRLRRGPNYVRRGRI